MNEITSTPLWALMTVVLLLTTMTFPLIDEEFVFSPEATMNHISYTRTKRKRIPLKKSKIYRRKDIVQRRYEMLRAHTVDRITIKDAAKSFDYSIGSYEKYWRIYNKDGILGLVPQKKGPKRRYKVSKEVLKIIVSNREKGMSVLENTDDLKQRGHDVSFNTVYRVLRDLGYPKKTTKKRSNGRQKNRRKVRRKNRPEKQR